MALFDDFLIRSLIAGIGVALIAGPMGCFVVWRRLAYFGETIAHSALLGITIAVVFDFNFMLGVLISSIAVVVVMYYIDRTENLPTETLLGLLAHGGLAIGLVVLSFFPNMRMDLEALLFGDILAVSRVDLVVIWIGGGAVFACLMFLWRQLLTSTVSEDLAQTAEMKPKRANLFFGLLMAILIAGAVKIVGILLIVALLIIPAATVRKFAISPEIMAALAALTGTIGVIGGLGSSLYWDTPAGPSMVVVLMILFALTRLGNFPIGRGNKGSSPSQES
ncbi:MAG: metal ABC transporter permease [Gammaproteobacteria bacterium]|nr:metal ABC transporter permease [Gammaproteobacteria bacterium]